MGQLSRGCDCGHRMKSGHLEATVGDPLYAGDGEEFELTAVSSWGDGVSGDGVQAGEAGGDEGASRAAFPTC